MIKSLLQQGHTGGRGLAAEAEGTGRAGTGQHPLREKDRGIEKYRSQDSHYCLERCQLLVGQ